ncbi:MAG: restriction endonuclease subunit S, partial [Bacilli bacterium]|nr:restriction endonuclease subunit S [Bacilli bacterium]
MSLDKFKDTEVGKIPVNWDLVSIGDQLDLITDYHSNGSYKTLREHVDLKETQDYALMVRTTNFEQNNFTDSLRYVDKSAYEFLEKSKVYPDDIIMNKIANAGSVYLMPDLKRPVSLAMNLFLLRMKPSVNQRYVYYYLKHNEKYLKTFAQGSVTKTITKDNVKKFPLVVPPLDIQNKIDYVLSLFYKKILALENINKNLQTLSKSLLKYHLEDFKPYLDKGIKNSEIGDIPKDWIVYEFDSISNIYNGYSYKGNELQQSNSAMVTIKNFNRDGSFRTDGFKEISYSNKVKDYHFVNEYDVLISCTDVTQDADIIGNCIILLDKKEYNDLIMSMDLVKIESKKKEINNFLLASILKSYRFKMHILGYVNGTTVLHLDKKGIKKFKLALPDDLSILKDLNDILENNYKQIAINQKEINKLQKLRDALLPKLMSGEIDVTKINCD